MKLANTIRIYKSIFLLLFLLSSCADYKLHYSKENVNWESSTPPTDLNLKHTMYLIGDAGGSEQGKALPAPLRLLGQKLTAADQENTSVVYLGDNIYPNGLASKKNAIERAEDEFKLKAQLDILKDFKGKIFFIPGNHDWYDHGLEGVKRQKKFIEEYLDRKDVFYPKPGCGDPTEVKINDQLALVIVDSQWYLEDWDGEYEINDGCEIKSREVFARYFEEAIKGNRNKNIVVATHHPPFTYGPHGGQATAKEHIFPLTDVSDGLFIPLPILGSIVQFYRANLGNIQDVAHPKYKELMSAMIGAARKNGSFIFASGHEHSLQYIEKENQSFIVSGAGSKVTPSSLGSGSGFAYGHGGISKLDFYEDGSTWLQFIIPTDDGGEKVVFGKQIKGPLADAVIEEETDFEPLTETTVRPLTDQPFGSGFLYEALWGKHYRKAYSTPVEVNVLDMNIFKGGVDPIKRGGGYQTNSLRLGDAEEKQYAMRSVDKDASRTLTYPFNQSIASDVIRDNFSASHPLAALAVPPLAKAAGIYYSNPALYFVAPQKRLSVFNADFSNALYLIEERPDDDVWGDFENFGYSDDIVSTTDVIEKVFGDHDHIVDYRWSMRSRLFDMLIGDWDRHDDQWRWAKIKEGDIKYYRPIPRDRDQAFSNYDGPILSIARQTSPNLKKLQVFKGDVKKIQWLIYNARHFDRTFLSGVEWKDWQEEAQAMQKNITDELIESAVKDNWPEELYAIDGPQIVKNLKSRRDNLESIARDAYLYLAREVDVIGTEKRDLFKIERLDNKRTRVRVFDTNKKAEEVLLIFDRTFLTDETKEIIVYGLDGDDFFNITGEVNQGIKIRIIGGLGDDSLNDNSKVGGGSKKTLYYDTPEVAKNDDGKGNHINAGPSTGLRLKDDPEFNTLYRRSLDYEFNFSTLLPSGGFNVDEGILLGLGLTHTTYGFKKSPYSSFHSLTGQIALATSGINLNYSGEFLDVFGNWEFQFDARFQTPMYSINFYGLGNDAINPEVEDPENFDIEYNRVSQRLFSVVPAFTRKLNNISQFSFGPTFESIRIDSTGDEDQNRFITTITDQFDPELFDGLEFLGARALIEYKNQDNSAFPTRGVGVNAELGWKKQLDDTEKSFLYLNSSLTMYIPLSRSGKLVVGTRLGVQHRFNSDFEFYQGAILGGVGPNANLRGFRRERFIGRTAFFQNIDLRWKLISSQNKKVPFTLGLLGGFDHGRVWLDGEDSDTWHYSYGGGIFISPLDVASIHMSLFYGDGEQKRFVFGGAFFFSFFFFYFFFLAVLQVLLKKKTHAC